MDVYTLDDLKNKHTCEQLLLEIESGALFVYPTDTIYGIGCNAADDLAVKQLRKLKKRDKKPLSVIVPNKNWITQHCDVPKKMLLRKLPGPYTLILPLKEKSSLSRLVTSGTVGVRLPKHPLMDLFSRLPFPVVTTSVNLSGRKNAVSLKTIPPSIRKHLDFAIDAGTLKGKPSTVIDGRSGNIIRT